MPEVLFMAWAYVAAAAGTGSLIFTDAMIYGDSGRMNSEVYKNIFSANWQRSFIMQHNNDPKRTANSTWDFIRVNQW